VGDERPLDGRVAIVTGGSGGIGRALSQRLAAAGAAVAVSYGANAAAADEVVREIAGAGRRAIALGADLRQADAAEALVARVEQALGPVDVLVANAGVSRRLEFDETDLETWEETLAVNLRAPFRLMRAAAPHLTARKGAVVNVSSVNGLRSFPGVLAYCVSKAGVDHLTRCAAIEMAPLGVRVNAVNPGVTVTNLHRRSGMGDTQYAAFLERSKETHPLGRPGQPDDIAALILFLASDRAGWMTGETIPIDGGRHLTCAR